MPDLHPQLRHTVPTRVARAAAKLLRASPGADVLAAYLTGGVHEVELEDVFLAGDFMPPCLLVAIEGEEEERSGSSHQATVRTLLRIALVQTLEASRGDNGHLRSRVVGEAKRLLVAPTAQDAHGAGVLIDPDVGAVTDYLEVFQRVPRPIQIPAQGLLVTHVQALWVSTIDFVTREYR